MPKARSQRCTYKEGNRRCPYDGEGVPSLCAPHRVALAEAAKPKPPARVLVDSLVDLLSGKPINREATIGAAEDFLSQWASGMGAGYRPDIGGDGSEDTVHRRGQSGHQRPWWWTPGHPSGGAAPQQSPEAELLALKRSAARHVMGFKQGSAPDADEIKKRYRELVKQHHPDRGGNAEKMATINGARDILMAELEGQ